MFYNYCIERTNRETSGILYNGGKKCGNKYPQKILYMFAYRFKKMLCLDSFLCFIQFP